MNIHQLDTHTYYYTDIASEEDIEWAINKLDSIPDNEWKRVYNDGKDYDPNADKDDFENQSVMLAYRKEFNPDKNKKICRIVNNCFKEASDHYKKIMNISESQDVPPMTSIDKHLTGTVYRTHMDTAPVDIKSYSILFYLNDNYEGGEISFSIPGKGNDNITVTNGILDKGPKGTYPPDHEVNKDLITFWLKPKPFSILIFPPLDPPYPHTAHIVKSGHKYLIKGHWQIDHELPVAWSSNPYHGVEDIYAMNPEGFELDGYQHELMKKGIDIVPEEYKSKTY